MTLGSLFKETRKKRGLTVMQVCEKVGISKSYYSKLENNKYESPAYEMALRIAGILCIDKETIDRYYNIETTGQGDLVLVNNSKFIGEIIKQNEHILNKKEVEVLAQLVNVSINLKKQGFRAEEVIRIMEILHQFISA